MKIKDVIEMMLSLLLDYDIANYTEEDLKLEVGVRINMVLIKARIFDLFYDSDLKELSRDITAFEATILAHGLLMQWLYPMVHNTEVLASQLTSKEFTAFSNANRINSMIQLQKNAQNEFYYLVNNYDDFKTRQAWKEDEQ